MWLSPTRLLVPSPRLEDGRRHWDWSGLRPARGDGRPSERGRGGAAGLGGWRCVPLGHTRGPAPAVFKGSASCPRAAGWMPGLARETVPSTPSAGGWTGTRAPRRLGTLWETSCPETGCLFLARVATWAPCRHLRAWWSPPPGWGRRLEGKGGCPARSCLLSWWQGSGAGGWTAALLVHLQ